jgi:ATP-dependent RNA helicase RhlE
LAVSLVTGADARLMADIEKLIKKKPDVEPFELEGRRERGHDRDRPSFRRREESEGRPDAVASDAPSRPSAPRASAPRRNESRDPFFDKPYEAPAGAELAAWDKKDAAPAPSSGSGLSRFIKPKRKVATLLGGSGTGSARR